MPRSMRREATTGADQTFVGDAHSVSRCTSDFVESV